MAPPLNAFSARHTPHCIICNAQRLRNSPVVCGRMPNFTTSAPRNIH
jgi:hypothetical protein